ncbi:MAG: hypothetical protein R3B06_01325 [Kofleriaceae bacterium]
MTRAALMLVALCGCGRTDPTPVPAHPPHPPERAAPAMPDVLPAIETVATLLTTSFDAGQVAAALGTPQPPPAPDGSSATFVVPTDPRISRARVAALPDGRVASVALTLAGPITVGALAARFGEFRVEPLPEPGAPSTLVFADAVAAADVAIDVIVDAPGVAAELPRQSTRVVRLLVNHLPAE